MQRHVRLIALSATALFAASMLWQWSAAENTKKKPAGDDGRITAETLDALPPTRYQLASDAIIIAFNFGPLPIGGGLFVLIKQEE